MGFNGLPWACQHKVGTHSASHLKASQLALQHSSPRVARNLPLVVVQKGISFCTRWQGGGFPSHLARLNFLYDEPKKGQEGWLSPTSPELEHNTALGVNYLQAPASFGNGILQPPALVVLGSELLTPGANI